MILDQHASDAARSTPGSERQTDPQIRRRHRKGNGMMVLIGPSGSGKSALVAALGEAGLIQLVPTWTTRARRGAETACADHHFVSEAEFAAARAARQLVSCVKAFDGHWYGAPRFAPFQGDGKLPVLMARAFVYDQVPPPDFGIIVYNLVADPETLRRRVARRSGRQEVLSRLAHCEAEMALGCVLADRTYTNEGPLRRLVAAMSDDLLEDVFAGRESARHG